jgi:hypothetical protein
MLNFSTTETKVQNSATSSSSLVMLKHNKTKICGPKKYNEKTKDKIKAYLDEEVTRSLISASKKTAHHDCRCSQ